MLCQRNIKGLVFIISLIVVLCTQAQTYNFRNYNTEHGLPQSQVLSMYQDTKGFVWFGMPYFDPLAQPVLSKDNIILQPFSSAVINVKNDE